MSKQATLTCNVGRSVVGTRTILKQNEGAVRWSMVPTCSKDATLNCHRCKRVDKMKVCEFFCGEVKQSHLLRAYI